MRSVILIAGAVILTGSAAVTNSGRDEDLARAVAEVERLDAMRTELAAGMGAVTNPDRSVFQSMCAPVGQEARRIAEANGWTVRQLADKYRNPVNEADPEAMQILHMLTADPNLQGLWLHTELQGVSGMRYFRRIEVQAACMPCHGVRDSRPEFIKSGYPRDRAYNFKVGDVRGVYSVFIPDQANR